MGDWDCTSTTTATTWGHWVSNSTTSTTADTWDTWIDCDATTTATSNYTTSTSTVWVQWTTSGQSGRRELVQRGVSPEERAAYERQQAEYRERQKAEAERYRAAKERAEGLLYEHLSDEQRAQIKRDKFFVVQGGKTGRKYKIKADGGLVANVHEMDDAGAVKRRLCAHLDHAANAPIFDHLLAQKLMLEHQEEQFLRVANDHGR
jgi:hypothetical protein